MAIPTRATSHGTFFISTQTYNRRRLFQVTTNAELFIETLQHYRREGQYKLHGFVVMPDHIHLLLTSQEITLERAVQLIKGGFSHKLESKLPVWQRGFTDHIVSTANTSTRTSTTSTTIQSELISAGAPKTTHTPQPIAHPSLPLEDNSPHRSND